MKIKLLLLKISLVIYFVIDVFFDMLVKSRVKIDVLKFIVIFCDFF